MPKSAVAGVFGPLHITPESFIAFIAFIAVIAVIATVEPCDALTGAHFVVRSTL